MIWKEYGRSGVGEARALVPSNLKLADCRKLCRNLSTANDLNGLEQGGASPKRIIYCSFLTKLLRTPKPRRCVDRARGRSDRARTASEENSCLSHYFHPSFPNIVLSLLSIRSRKVHGSHREGRHAPKHAKPLGPGPWTIVHAYFQERPHGEVLKNYPSTHLGE